jgi:putative intracellular protease/amidase
MLTRRIRVIGTYTLRSEAKRQVTYASTSARRQRSIEHRDAFESAAACTFDDIKSCNDLAAVPIDD